MSFFDEIAKLLEGSLVDGQKLKIVAKGDPRLYAYLTMGALREVLVQTVARGASYENEELVESIFGFLSSGYLRMGEEVLPPTTKRPTKARKRANA